MGHQNTQFTGHMIDMQTDQQGSPHPEPCIFYNFPQPHNIRSVVPITGNHCNFNLRHMSERTHLNGVQTRHPVLNLDLAIATPSGHYNPYLVAPPSAIRDFPFPMPTTHRIVGIPTTDNYGRNMSYMDGSFKRKNAVEVHIPSVGPSSFVDPSESNSTLMDAASLYGSNVPTPMVESGSQVSTRTGHLVQGGFVASPAGGFGWMHAPIPYGHALDISASNRSSSGFLPPPLAQGHPNPRHPPPPMQGIRGYNVSLPSQVASSSRRNSTISSSNTGINLFQDFRPTFLPPVPPAAFQLYRPQQREFILSPCTLPHTLPHLRVLPEDEVSILEIPSYHEAGDSVDWHRDMRLDIDNMSYEELLALGEQIGSVGTGLPEEFIKNYLKIRTFTSSAAFPILQDETCVNQQINFCVICQTDYENEQDIGAVDCGHEYHRECIKKWLLLKNTCPVCKSTALTGKSKDL